MDTKYYKYVIGANLINELKLFELFNFIFMSKHPD